MVWWARQKPRLEKVLLLNDAAEVHVVGLSRLGVVVQHRLRGRVCDGGLYEQKLRWRRLRVRHDRHVQRESLIGPGSSRVRRQKDVVWRPYVRTKRCFLARRLGRERGWQDPTRRFGVRGELRPYVRGGGDDALHRRSPHRRKLRLRRDEALGVGRAQLREHPGVLGGSGH